MSLKDAPVPMPEKRVTFKKQPNGTVYVYYTVRAYRNKRGQPTSDEVAIGKKDMATGELIPNRNYYDIFKIDLRTQTKMPEVVPRFAQNCGNTLVLMQIAKQTGLVETLTKCFPYKWEQMLACAFYMICEGNVMMYIENWFDVTKVNFTKRMDDIDCSKLFASITEEERRNFFTHWIEYRRESEMIVYDVSSISTYSKNIDIAEWGYNRDNDPLPQINLGMYYGVTSTMPVYYDLYNGSIPDKSYLEFMMINTLDLGICEVCFVIDRGFVTEENFQCMREHNFSFITALPGSRKETVRLIEVNKAQVKKAANWISEYKVFGFQCPTDLYGHDLQAHIYYDPVKQNFDVTAMFAKIDKLKQELGKISKSKGVTKKFNNYFVINDKTQDTIKFELDTENIDAIIDRTGYFILLSNNKSLSSNDVIKIYRNRDVIEKNFDQFKNHLDFKRMRTHWTKTTEGKMFIGFIALILRSYMCRLLKQDSKTKHLTFEKAMLELKKIQSHTLSDKSEVMTPLTKLQKTILESLSISPELSST